MFFVLSKLFWLVASPSNVLGFLVLATALCLLLRWMRAARVLGVLAGLLLVVGGLTPIPRWAVLALEDQYPRPVAAPAHVDGVLILGGGFDTALLKARRAPQSNGALLRVVEAFGVARRHPEARIVFSGGSGLLHGQQFSEAESARYLLDEMGLDAARLTLENRSRNTYENILFSRQIVKPKKGQVWLLATSAIHMPRAMAIARKQDWPMQAWPTDYITSPDKGVDFSFGGVSSNLDLLGVAAREWIGLVVYRATGRAA